MKFKKEGSRKKTPPVFFLLLCACFLFVACASQSATPTLPPTETPLPTFTPISTAPTPTLTPPPFRIIGYVTAAVIVELLPFDKLTHINYAFLIPNADGTFKHMANLWKLDNLVKQAHTHNVQVLISVGGWGWDKEFETLAADPTRRATFVSGLVQFVADHQLDGADIDWEYPDVGDSAQNFLALMREVRAALLADKLLTAAVVAVNGDSIPAEAFALMDFVNLMAYDGDGANHASMQYAEDSITYWQGRGLPPEKTVLGVPFYSHPRFVAYKKLIEADPAAAQVDEFEYSGALANYNGLPTMRQKTTLAQQRASGVMIWTLEHDTVDEYSLLKAIYETAHHP